MGPQMGLQRTKEELLEMEAASLEPYAKKSRDTKGREHPEPEPTSPRLCYETDRNRLVHSKAYRRLDGKTQVLPSFHNDHLRTRSSHTHEVASISRGIARRLGLNEDLVEAIAIAHDLGHTPFGHAGEKALNEVMERFGKRFEHNEQSYRVVTELENRDENYPGLNLSIEVLDGLKKHQSAWDQSGKDVGEMHLEGQVVNLADEIAYTAHDLDDGLRSSILKLSDVSGTRLWERAMKAVVDKDGDISDEELLVDKVRSRIIAILVDDVCDKFDGESITFTSEIREELAEMREVLRSSFYQSEFVKGTNEAGMEMVTTVFDYYLEHPDKLPEKYRGYSEIEDGLRDYIAGMTDEFLISQFQNINK